MMSSLAALEFDRVLRLVASFARSEPGQAAILATLPRFEAAEGSLAFALTRDVERFTAVQGTLSFTGLEGVHILRATAGETPDVTDLGRLVSLVRRIVEVRAGLAAAGELGAELGRRLAALPQLDGLLSFSDMRLGPAGEILDSASPLLARARAGRERHRYAIIAALERMRRVQPSLTAPFTVRRERYCVPVPSADRASVQGLVLDVSGSGATLFIEPFEVVELNNAVAEAIAQAREEEERVLAELAAAFARRRDDLLCAAAILAELDAAQARVLFGKAARARLLEPGVGVALRLAGARHPLLDPMLAALRADVLGEGGSMREVVPLELAFPEDARLVLLSGPNAGGKTVALKTLGLAALMVQSGIPVLADEGSVMPRVSRVWCHIGDEQNLLSDLSTFTGAMRATADLLAEADADTLVLYDEIGSGTDPEEGAALAAVILEELLRRRCWTVATAHLVTVAAHVEQLSGALNAAMGYDEDTHRPTYRLQLGIPGRSRGLAIASGCGVPETLLARARGLLSQAYLAIDTYLDRLQQAREGFERETEELAAKQRAAGEAERRAERAYDELVARQAHLRAELDREREKLRRRAKEQLDGAFAELGRARESGELPGKRRIATIRRAALALGGDAETPPVAVAFAPGSAVRVRGLETSGIISRVVGERLEVQVGDKRLWVERSDCDELASPAKARPAPPAQAGGDMTAEAEIKLLGFTQDEARDALERFIDHALLAGARRVRVVHGHGSGTLRRMVREYLAGHPAVARFAHPPQYRGGTGVTEVELEA